MLRAILAIAVVVAGQNTPEQVWSSYGDAPLTTLRISFSTNSSCSTPQLRFGLSPTSLSPAPASALSVDPPFLFDNSGGLHYYYRAALSGLASGTRYFYQVAACGEWSSIFYSGTLPEGTDFKVLVWGDMGRDGGEQILPALLEEARAAANGASNSASFSVIAG